MPGAAFAIGQIKSVYPVLIRGIGALGFATPAFENHKTKMAAGAVLELVYG